MRKLGTTSGGALSECLNELVQCGFLRCYNSIDMLIDRADGVVDVCEIKYSAEPYEMTKEENERIQHRCLVFQKNGHVRRAVRAILIASAGLKPGKYRGNIMAVVTDDDLFAEVMT